MGGLCPKRKNRDLSETSTDISSELLNTKLLFTSKGG